MTALPPPPVPPDADLTHFDDMPLEVRRLRDSGIAGTADAEAFRCGLLSWAVAWHQLPAGSLSKDDADLCRLVGLGRDLKTWKRIKASAMRGWREFADGRLYHPVLTEKVIAAWNSTRINRWNKECDRLRKENKAREKRKEDLLPFPEKPDAIPYIWPKDSGANSQGSPDGVPPENPKPPPENALNRMEGNGIENPSVAAAASSGGDAPCAQGGQIPAETPPPDDSKPPPFLDRNVDKAFAIWNACAVEHGWPQAQILNSTRRWSLQNRLAECGGIEGWRRALDAAAVAKFLLTADGKLQSWFDLDWVISKPVNFAKLIEGRFAERRQSVETPTGETHDQRRIRQAKEAIAK